MELDKLYGTWTVNTQPFGERALKGYLKYDEETGVFLETAGAFVGLPHTLFTNFPIIHGEIKNLDCAEISLFNCKPVGSMPGVEGYSADFALIGANFENEADIKVNRIRLTSKAIKYVFVDQVTRVIDDKPTKVISFKKPKDRTIKLKENGNIKLVSRHELKRNKHNYNISIEQDIDIEFQLDDYVGYKEAIDYISTVVSYMTFVLQQAPDIGRIDFSTSKGDVQVLFGLRKGMLGEKTSYERWRLFWMDEVKSFGRALDRWFEMNKKISPTLKILFDSYLVDYEFSENAFLNMCQAIELFHRQYYPISEDEKKGFYDNLDRILMQITDAGDKKYLKEVIGGYAHEKRLRHRLKECFGEIKDTEVYSKLGNEKRLINKIVAGRNYYTHYDPNSKDQVVELDELARITAKLKILLLVLILKKLGKTTVFVNHLLKIGRFPGTLLAFHDNRHNNKKSN
jgi:hypothetical protein